MSGEDDLIFPTSKELKNEEVKEDDRSNEEITTNEEEDDGIDPDFTNIMQDIFQDELVDSLFYDIFDYIKENALSICGFLNRDGIEKIIDKLSVQ
jgi:hypothetical protein